MRYLLGMTQIKEIRPEGKKRVRKQDWLDAALDLLRSGGIDAVRVERLAATLGVAKSGFYYHFKDRSALHAALLQHWVDLDHAPMNALRRHPGATPAEQLRIIAEVVDRADLSRYDFAVRQWARRDLKARRIWRAEMNKRIGLIRDTLAQLGFEGDALEMRTRLFTAYHVSERDLFADLTTADRARLRELRLNLLLDT
ncbi:MAG: TetR family transcriptional regulator [Dinoroseobacter sp.]|nr:TetR family transcriptional regulator [Dinoroseobacter sp.]